MAMVCPCVIVAVNSLWPFGLLTPDLTAWCLHIYACILTITTLSYS